MSIRDLQISGYSSGDEHLDGRMTEPPEQLLNVSVIGGVAFLDIQNLEEDGTVRGAKTSIKVPAKSLVRAVQTLIADEQD